MVPHLQLKRKQLVLGVLMMQLGLQEGQVERTALEAMSSEVGVELVGKDLVQILDMYHACLENINTLCQHT